MRRRRLFVWAVVTAMLAGAMPLIASAAGTATVSIGDATVAEPNDRTGTVAVELPVTLHGGTAGASSVAWGTAAGTACTADFVTASGTLSIPAGAAGGTIVVTVRADRTAEPTEAFSVELSSASGAAIGDAVGQVAILPVPSGLALGDVIVTEPDAGTLRVAVVATLGALAKKDVTFGWQLRSVTGTVGQDAPAASGTGRIAKGALGTVIPVTITGDTTVEPNEDLEIVVTSVANSALADGIGRITLRNTDVAPPPTPSPSPTPTPTPTPKPTPTPTPTPRPTPTPTPTPAPSASPTPAPSPTPSPTPTPLPFEWQPPEGAVPATGTAVYAESASGDYIGQGRTYLYTNANAILTVSPSGSRVRVIVNGDEGWDATFAQPSSSATIQTGVWDNLGRYPFHVPGLAFGGEGRGCNELVGRFAVDEVSYAAGVLQTLTLRFEQLCQGSSAPLLGFIRYDASDFSEPPPPGDAADFPWSPPAGAVPETGNYLYFESSAGDYIGQGRTDLYTEVDSSITPDWYRSTVQVFIGEAGTTPTWNLNVDGRWNQTKLAVGLYENVQRWGFHNPASGGLSFTGEGRGCNKSLSTFAVDEITYEGTELQSVSLRFVQRCEVTNPPLYGALRWTSP